jgi:hypothetical protein
VKLAVQREQLIDFVSRIVAVTGLSGEEVWSDKSAPARVPSGTLPFGKARKSP